MRKVKTTYSTKWGSDTVIVSADWGEASSPVDGVSGGRQVADFRHSGSRALRAAIEECAEKDGMDLEDDDTIEKIDGAMDEIMEGEEDEDEDEDEIMDEIMDGEEDEDE